MLIKIAKVYIVVSSILIFIDFVIVVLYVYGEWSFSTWLYSNFNDYFNSIDYVQRRMVIFNSWNFMPLRLISLVFMFRKQPCCMGL